MAGGALLGANLTKKAPKVVSEINETVFEDENGQGIKLNKVQRKAGGFEMGKTFVQADVIDSGKDPVYRLRFLTPIAIADNIRSIAYVRENDELGRAGKVIDTVYANIKVGDDRIYYDAAANKLTTEEQSNDYYFALYNIDFELTSSYLIEPFRVRVLINGMYSSQYMQTSYQALTAENPYDVCEYDVYNGATVVGTVINMDHMLETIPESTGNCAYDTIVEHQHCTRCDKMFVDGVEKTADELKVPGNHTLQHIKEVPASCKADGVKAHDHCTTCKKDFIDGVEVEDLVIPADPNQHINLEHFDEVPGDGTCLSYTVVAHDVCKDCGAILVNGEVKTEEELKVVGSHNLEHIDGTPATCDHDGIIECDYCDICEKYFVDGKEVDDVVIPGGHKLTHVALDPATCVPGTLEHDYCEVCKKYFIDGEEVSADKIKEEHDYDENGVCKNCGAHTWASNYHILEESEIQGTGKQIHIGSGNNQPFSVNNPGYWAIQASNNGTVINEGESFLGSCPSHKTAAKYNCYCRIVPNKDICDNGGVFLFAADLTVQDNQTGLFQFGVSCQTSGTAFGNSIKTAEINEATPGKTYHIDILVRMPAATYFMLVFKNVSNGNCKVLVHNVMFTQYAADHIPSATIDGVNALTWPWKAN